MQEIKTNSASQMTTKGPPVIETMLAMNIIEEVRTAQNARLDG